MDVKTPSNPNGINIDPNRIVYPGDRQIVAISYKKIKEQRNSLCELRFFCAMISIWMKGILQHYT